MKYWTSIFLINSPKFLSIAFIFHFFGVFITWKLAESRLLNVIMISWRKNFNEKLFIKTLLIKSKSTILSKISLIKIWVLSFFFPFFKVKLKFPNEKILNSSKERKLFTKILIVTNSLKFSDFIECLHTSQCVFLLISIFSILMVFFDSIILRM